MGTFPSTEPWVPCLEGRWEMFTLPGRNRRFLVLTSPVEDLGDAGQEVEFTKGLITGDQQKPERICLWTPPLLGALRVFRRSAQPQGHGS